VNQVKVLCILRRLRAVAPASCDVGRGDGWSLLVSRSPCLFRDEVFLAGTHGLASYYLALFRLACPDRSRA